ncbi:MAG: SRPBCC domain-containing protein [Anaerolineaceae bacterium]|nr:SRPBCC domain-containing protein [Anaerolineaceae bacterium]
MSEKLELSVILTATPQQVYEAWLDSKAHADFTGSPAKIDPRVNGDYTAWDGYIWGKTLALEPFRFIRQSWRTSEFPENAPDSFLDVSFEAAGSGTKLTLIHTDIPDGQSEQYRQGWEDYYFEPMNDYFKT